MPRMAQTRSHALRFFAELTRFMIKRQHTLFLRLLFGTQCFQLFGQMGDVLFQLRFGRLRCEHFFMLRLFERGNFAQFTLQRERTRG